MEEAAEAEIQDGEIVQKSDSEDNPSKKLTDTIDSLTLEFTCTICQELFVEARTLKCAHTFCAHCLDGWLKRNSRSLRRSCPICRRRVETKGFPSIVLDSAIDKMIDTVGGEQKERRLELKRSREEQKQEEDPFDDSHIMPTGLQDGDASEQSDRNFRRNLIRNSRRRRREQSERQGSTQSSRYGFLRPPFFVPASDTEEIFDFSDAPSTPVISFPLDRSDEVPVIDLTTSPSDVAIDGSFLQGAQNESSSNDVIYGPFLPGEQDRNHAESSNVINVDVIDFETQFLVEVEIEHTATIPTSTTPPPELD